MKLSRSMMLATVLALNSFGSCGTVKSAREKLEAMDELEFQNLVSQVVELSTTGGKRLSGFLAPEDKAPAKAGFNLIADAVKNDKVENLNLFIKQLLKDKNIKFVSDPELNAKLLEVMNDAIDLISATVGTIELGLDGTLSVRERALVVALFSGVASGIE